MHPVRCVQNHPFAGRKNLSVLKGEFACFEERLYLRAKEAEMRKWFSLSYIGNALQCGIVFGLQVCPQIRSLLTGSGGEASRFGTSRGVRYPEVA